MTFVHSYNMCYKDKKNLKKLSRFSSLWHVNSSGHYPVPQALGRDGLSHSLFPQSRPFLWSSPQSEAIHHHKNTLIFYIEE